MLSDEDLMALGAVLADFIGAEEYCTVSRKDNGTGYLVLDGNMTVTAEQVEALIGAGAEDIP